MEAADVVEGEEGGETNSPDAQTSQQSKRGHIHRTQPLKRMEKLPRYSVIGHKASAVSYSGEIILVVSQKGY